MFITWSQKINARIASGASAKKTKDKTKEYIRVLRRFLFLIQRRRCHWCDCEMVVHSFSKKKGVKTVYPDNTLTYDHYYEVYDPRRHELLGNVAACMKCNSERSINPRRYTSYWGA